MASKTFTLDEVLKTPILQSIEAETVKSILSSAPFVNVPGVFNFRDLGGLPIVPATASTGDDDTTSPNVSKLKVRPGVVFRSAHLTHITPAGCDALRDLGIGAIFDFRTEGEIKRDAPSSQPISSTIPNATPQALTTDPGNADITPPTSVPARNASSVKFTENGLPDLSEQSIQVHHIPLQDLKVLTKQDMANLIATYCKGDDGFLEGYEKTILAIGGKSFGTVLRYILEQSQKGAIQEEEEGDVKACVWNCHSASIYLIVLSTIANSD
jgi:hypothetical protein